MDGYKVGKDFTSYIRSVGVTQQTSNVIAVQKNKQRENKPSLKTNAAQRAPITAAYVTHGSISHTRACLHFIYIQAPSHQLTPTLTKQERVGNVQTNAGRVFPVGRIEHVTMSVGTQADASSALHQCRQHPTAPPEPRPPDSHQTERHPSPGRPTATRQSAVRKAVSG